MSEHEDRSLGDVALEEGLITEDQLKDCLREQAELRARGEDGFLGQILLRRLLVDPPTLMRLLHECRRRAWSIPSFSRYEIEDKIGQGGMAEVFRATDRELKRVVAVKVLREQTGASPSARKRFQHEAQAFAKLSHPNVVTIHDAGEEGGRMFLVMELVKGESLEKLLARKALDLRGRVEILERVARGVHHAHEHAIIHRDIKPSNILVTEKGEPKVADFGLARLNDSETLLTKSGTAIGTPSYMSPEQVRGRDIDFRSDVYSLGAILYEMLTGRRPHAGESAMEIYGKITGEEPVAPRKIEPSTPVELETIALKAMEKDPSHRYPTAAAFAQDLRRHLSGEAISARPPSTVERVVRKLARHRGVILPAAAAVVIALGAWIAVGAISRSRRVAAQLEAASRAESEGRIEDARDAFRSALDLDSENAEANRGFGRTDGVLKRRAREKTDREAAEREAHALIESGRTSIDKAVASLYSRDSKYEEILRRVEEGQPLLERAVERAPWLPLAHHLLGRAWDIKGYDQKAEACWRKAIELDPGFGPAHLCLGRLLLSRGFLTSLSTSEREQDWTLPEAERILREAQREFEAATAVTTPLDRDVAGLMIAYLRKDFGEFKRRAAEGISKYARQDGVEEFHWMTGLPIDGDEQIQAYDRALAIRPKYPLALLCRGVAWHLRRDFTRALADYDEALRVNPRMAQAFCNRGAALRELKRLDEALAACDEAIRLKPGYAHAFATRGLVKYSRFDYRGSIEDFTEAIRLGPRDWVSRSSRGLSWYALEDYEKALADFNAALGLYDKFAPPWIGRGLVRHVRGDTQGAIADYTEAIRLDSKSIEAYLNRAIARQDLREFDAAIADCDRAIGLEPKNAEAYFQRALCQHQKGDADAAVADYTRTIELDPKHVLAHLNRGGIRYILKNVRGALDDFDAAAKIDPKSATAFNNRGSCRRDLGDREGAKSDYTRAIELDPKYADAYVNRARVRHELDDTPGAIADLEKALAVAPEGWPNRDAVRGVLENLRKE